MSINVLIPEGLSFTIPVQLQDTIAGVKDRVAQVHGVSLHQRDLFYNQMMCADNFTLGAIGCHDGANFLAGPIKQAVFQGRMSAPIHPMIPNGFRPRQHSEIIMAQPAYGGGAGVAFQPASTSSPLSPASTSRGLFPVTGVEPSSNAQTPKHPGRRPSNPFEEVEAALAAVANEHPIAAHLYEQPTSPPTADNNGSTPRLGEDELRYVQNVRDKLNRSRTAPHSIKVKTASLTEDNDFTKILSPTSTTPISSGSTSSANIASPASASTSISSGPGLSPEQPHTPPTHTRPALSRPTTLFQYNVANNSDSPTHHPRSSTHSPSSSISELTRHTTNLKPSSFRHSITAAAVSPRNRLAPTSDELEHWISDASSDARIHCERAAREKEEFSAQIEKLKLQLCKAIADRDAQLALVRAQSFEQGNKIRQLEEEIAAEEAKTKAALADIETQAAEEKEKIQKAEIRLAGMEAEREASIKAAKNAVAAMKLQVGAIAARRGVVESEHKRITEENVESIVKLITESGLDDEITTRLYEIRQEKVANVIQTLALSPSSTTQ